MKKYISVFVFLVVLLFGIRVNAATERDFQWEMEDGAVVLTQYTGADTAVTVPATMTLEGVEYPVALDAATVFRDNTRLRQVTLSPGVGFRGDSMARLFMNCENLESVEAVGLDTASVTSMRSAFSGCGALRQIRGLEEWDTGKLESIAYMFNQTRSLEQVDLSRWDLSALKNSGWCFQYCDAKTILLPDSLPIISAGFLNHAREYAAEEFVVPAGVKRIGYAHTLYDFGTDELTRILVAPGNTNYKSEDGILLSSDGREFLAVPRNKTFPEGVYEMPEGVTFLGELSFSRNYNLKRLILPDSLELTYVPRNDPAYVIFEDTGNLNEGLNLNIAIYCYTGIREYGVKETNPRYREKDGILYSKDMTQLVAVPTRYEGILDIPEGVRVWREYAMWNAGDLVDSLMSGCTGVRIPASLTDISPDQLAKLNRLAIRYGMKISLDEGNPAYDLRKGQLVARPRLAEAEVTLSEDTFVYDGSEKKPEVTVQLGEKRLAEGADFTLAFENNRDAGVAKVMLTALGGIYGTKEVSFVIQQAQPVCPPPEDLSAIYGQTLEEIPLPENFYWRQTGSVGNAGINTFRLRYVPADPNYRSVENIAVQVQVAPRQVTVTTDAGENWYFFTGKPVEPKIAAPDVPAEEYTVTFEKNLWFGKAGFSVEDVPGGNFTVSGGGSFWILPGPGLTTGTLVAVGLLLWLVLRRRKEET